MRDSTDSRTSAAVIGGSMAGLLAARVLSEHFDHVTIVERDALPSLPQNRRGVPQGKHLHGLLATGAEILEQLFPGLGDDLLALGGLEGDPGRDVRIHAEGGYRIQFTYGQRGFFMSRPVLEAVVRRRVLGLPNVSLRQSSVTGLASSPRAVHGVRIGDETLDADLTVDCSGRGSSSPRWLDAMGYTPPKVENVQISLTYTTRHFRRQPDDLPGDLCYLVMPTVSGKRGGALLAESADTWAVTLAGAHGVRCPPELDRFVDFARTLPAPEIWDYLRGAEPIDEPAVTHYRASTRRHYEKLLSFPSGYLVMGDAFASFNPIYGQGMTVAAIEARDLRGILGEGDENLAKRTFRRWSTVVDSPWLMAVGADLKFPETIGDRRRGSGLVNRYLDRMAVAMQSDPDLALIYSQVINLAVPPARLFRPSTAFKVARAKTPDRPVPAPVDLTDLPPSRIPEQRTGADLRVDKARPAPGIPGPKRWPRSAAERVGLGPAGDRRAGRPGGVGPA